MPSIDVFDFDKTIYDGDSTIDFYLFCLRRHPKCILYLPKQVLHALRYRLKKEQLLTFKESFFSFLKEIEDVGQEVELFWKQYQRKIKPWYKQYDRQSRSQLIISASPYFLIKPIGDLLMVEDVIASEVDPKTGQFNSPNCAKEEKVRRFKEKYPKLKIQHFYSDSISDLPMAKLAAESYWVKKNEVTLWEIED